MATRKRNEWLDADESDDDINNYASEEESRSKLLPSSKRQKHTHTSASEASDIEEPQDDELPSEDEIRDITHVKPASTSKPLPSNLPTTRFDESPVKATKKTKLKPNKPKKDRSGIIYLSRIPPFMKPSVLRSLLTPHGEIGRIFCTPETASNRTSRLQSGSSGTRRKLYLDGWVEFLSKNDAKLVAEQLNAQIIGGKKRSKWHDEVWNMRYLRGVKWSHLVEQIRNEDAERVARLRSEIAQSTRENKRFLENVERGKMVAGMEAKKKRKAEERGEDQAIGKRNLEREEVKEPRRTFKQREKQLKGKKPADDGEGLQRIMSSIM